MKIRLPVYIKIGLSVLCLVGIYGIISRFSVQSQRGLHVEYGLVGGKEAWYNKSIFDGLSTIATNPEYGTFVFKRNGEFVYFPEEQDILNDRTSRLFRYDGIWYKDGKLRLAVTREYKSRETFKENLLYKIYYLDMSHIWSDKMDFNENLKINDHEFILINNYMTRSSSQKLRIDDEIIEEFLKEK